MGRTIRCDTEEAYVVMHGLKTVEAIAGGGARWCRSGDHGGAEREGNMRHML